LRTNAFMIIRESLPMLGCNMSTANS
jgi:hypothetical protein